MVRTLLVRGMLVGIVAGLLCFAFLKLYGEPQLEQAIAFETELDESKAASHKGTDMSHRDTSNHSHKDMSQHHHEEPELVSRSVQAGLGLLTGVVVYNTAFGGLFALAFAFAYGRVAGPMSAQTSSVLLAALGFVAVYLIPNLKYPANPPAVGDPQTIGMRTALYFIMIAISLAAMIAALGIKRPLVSRLGNWNGTLVVAASYLVLVAIAGLLLPSFNEVPEGFPAAVLWNFRIASMGAQLIMWATFGLLFGALTQRALARSGPMP
jgi:predicted cobalt transporter CbtA